PSARQLALHPQLRPRRKRRVALVGLRTRSRGDARTLNPWRDRDARVGCSVGLPFPETTWDPGRMLDFVGRLRSLLLADAWFVEVLRAVREGNLPDWVVGSGVIRSLVWDRLHGFERRTPVRDVDVAFFDRANPSRERDEEVEVELRRRLPSVPWQVTNQAGVHLWYERRFGHPSDPIASIEDAVGRWPET